MQATALINRLHQLVMRQFRFTAEIALSTAAQETSSNQFGNGSECAAQFSEENACNKPEKGCPGFTRGFETVTRGHKIFT